MIPPIVSAAALAASTLLAPTAPSIDAPVVVQEPAADAAPKWTGVISAAGVLTDGNSQTRGGAASASAELKREHDRFSLGFLWSYSEEKNTTPNWQLTQRKTSGRGQYDYFFTKETYFLGQVSGENDYQADLELRTTAGVGLGHQFIDREELKFSGEIGAAYITEDYKTSSSTDDYVAGRAAINTTWVANKTWTITHRAEAFPSLEDQNDVNGRSDLRVAASFTENMLVQFQWVLDYDNTPAAGKDRVDNTYIVTLGWKF